MTLFSLNSDVCHLASQLPVLAHLPGLAYQTEHGIALLGDSRTLLAHIPDNTVDLVFTSPPFALRRKKKYGNEAAEDYVNWFLDFARDVRRVLKDTGSFVIDIGGSWTPGEPTKSLYHYRLLIALVDEIGLHLAQEVFWYNHARLPTPAQWVCRERVRLKDAVNMVWWLSKTTRPKADNRRVLTQYKPDQKKLIASGKYNRGRRPSEHVISDQFGNDNGGAIPPNFLDEAILASLVSENVAQSSTVNSTNREGEAELTNLIRAANTASKDRYLQGCKALNIEPHPARIPQALPNFFIRFLTEPGDLVLDLFAGSNVTGAVAEELKRKWVAMEINADYLFASQTRFVDRPDKLLATCSHFEWVAKSAGTLFQYPAP